jgi:hypothetical protein
VYHVKNGSKTTKEALHFHVLNVESKKLLGVQTADGMPLSIHVDAALKDLTKRLIYNGKSSNYIQINA